MKKFKIYYRTLKGLDTRADVEASNQGIAIARFKQSVNDCLKILKIEKEK